MKRLFSLLVVIILCFSVCACGKKADNSGNKPTKTILVSKEELEAGFEGCEGQLDWDTDDDYGMARFRKTIKDINAEKVLDKNFAKAALTVYLQTPSDTNEEQAQVCSAYNGIICLQKLFEYNTNNFSTEEYIDDLITTVCDKKQVQYNNWIITIEIDTESDRIIIEGDNTYGD